MEKREYLFVKSIEFSAELLKEGFTMHDISKDKHKENRFLFWFKNERDLEDRIEQYKAEQKKKYDERMALAK